MKKIFYLILIIGLFLSGCNFPQENTNPKPKPNVLATAVSLTLTAKPIIPTSAELMESPVKEQTPTTTLTPTLTTTNTITPTVTPDSLKKTLGTPIWQSQLDNGKSFGLEAGGYQDENTHIFIKNSAMVLSSTSTVGFRTWRLTSPTPKDFYLEATFKTLSCGNADSYGLVYRAPDYSSGYGYYFGVTCSGNYSLYKWTSSGSNIVLNGNNPTINTGTNQIVRIGIMARGNDFTFYVNDKAIQNFNDSDLPNAGHFGTFIGGYSGNFEVQMDEIAYWELH